MKSDKRNGSQDLSSEKRWHLQNFYIDSGHWTSHPLFASRERHWLQNEIQKIRFYGYLSRYIKHKAYRNSAKILMAPVGDGIDFKYLQGMFSEIHGIDISNTALYNCPNIIIKKEGDILKSGYEESSFDIIVCVLFLHHVHKVGFKPFIEEFCRLLKDEGTLAILEPNLLFPFSWATALATKIMGNVTGKVEGEKPIFAPELTKIIRIYGFKRIRIRGLSFNHARFPCSLQLLINLFDYPFRALWPFSLFSGHIGWFCEKPVK